MECKYHEVLREPHLPNMNYGSQISVHVKKLIEHGYKISNLRIDCGWILAKNNKNRVVKYKSISIPHEEYPDQFVTIYTTYRDSDGFMRSQSTTGRTQIYSSRDYKEYIHGFTDEPRSYPPEWKMRVRTLVVSE